MRAQLAVALTVLFVSLTAASASVIAGDHDRDDPKRTGQTGAANVWVATTSRIALITPSGETLAEALPSAPRQSFALNTGHTMDVDSTDGGLWVLELAGLGPDGNLNRLFKLDRTGALVREFTLRQASVLKVDSRTGSLWSTVQPPISGTPARDVVKLNPFGEEVVRIGGFGFVDTVEIDDLSGTLWVFDGELVRLTGSNEQLNGYDASGPSGPHHRRISIGFVRSISVDPRRGNVWLANNKDGAQFVKLSPAGEVLATGIPSFGFDAFLVEADPVNGGAWGLVINGDEGLQQFSRRGKQIGAIRIFRSVGDFTALERALFPRTFALDPYGKSLWLGADVFVKDSPIVRSRLLLLDYRGRRLLNLRQPGVSKDIEIQTIRIPIVVELDSGDHPRKAPARTTVAVLTKGDFDALQVDPVSARFGPRGAAPLGYAVRDVDSDGDADLVFHFQAHSFGIRCGDRAAELTARTHEGTFAVGWGVIRAPDCSMN